MPDNDFDGAPPRAEHVTPYDERHLVTYLRLLDADAEKADWREAVSLIFGIDPDVNEAKAKSIHSAHLDRAKWMTRVGYRDLLAKAAAQRKA